MVRHTIPKDDIQAVRQAVLEHEHEAGLSHAQIAVACRLSYHAVADFLEGRRDSERVVAHLVAYLDLGMIYEPARIRHSAEPR